jgi:glycine/sarcosine N-methyltransferase
MEDSAVFYEGFADSYDDMVDWEKRLAFEGKFFDKLFKHYGVEKILDAACGTGRHSILFSKMGYKVLGVDNNESMLELARKNAKAGGVKGLRLQVADFLTLCDLIKSRFDTIVCLGNSLPHLVDDEDVLKALRNFFKLLKPGGLLLLQTVYFDHYLDSADSAVAVRDGLRNGRQVTFRRHYEFKGTKVIFHVSIYDLHSRELLENFSTPLNPIRRELLEAFLEKVGFTGIQFFEDISLKSLTTESRSLIGFAFRPKA